MCLFCPNCHFLFLLLQVTWDEPDLLQNVKRVSPWLVELVSNMPAIHLNPFSPPRKKLRLPQHPDFPLDGQIPIPSSFSGNLLGPTNPFGCLQDNNTPAGMQGARHAHYSGLSLSDNIHLNRLQSGLFSAGFPPLDRTAPPTRSFNSAPPPLIHKRSVSENISCLLTIAHPSGKSSKKADEPKTTPQLVLFGQPILTEQQISLSCSGDTVSPVLTANSSSEGNGSTHHQQSLTDRLCEGLHWFKDNRQDSDSNLETGHCKVFMESEDVGRTLNLSLLGSYDEFYKKLAEMFGIENSDTLNHVLYRDMSGAVKHIGDEPFRSGFFPFTKRM